MGAIEIKVRSVWQGKIGVHSKYYEEAVKKKVGLTIQCDNEYMFLTPEQVEKPVAQSKELFRDSYNKTFYRLVYYRWKPTLGQQKLL